MILNSILINHLHVLIITYKVFNLQVFANRRINLFSYLIKYYYNIYFKLPFVFWNWFFCRIPKFFQNIVVLHIIRWCSVRVRIRLVRTLPVYHLLHRKVFILSEVHDVEFLINKINFYYQYFIINIKTYTRAIVFSIFYGLLIFNLIVSFFCHFEKLNRLLFLCQFSYTLTKKCSRILALWNFQMQTW